MYTPEQAVDRWEAQRDLKNLMGKYALTLLLEERDTVCQRFWSRRQDISLALNEGWYLGPDAVQGYYSAQARRTEAESALLCRLFPEKVKDFTPEQRKTLGHLDNRPVSAPVICVAEDMATAQGMWTSVGCYNEFSPDYGPQSHWSWQVFAVDFIWEEDSWRIWHMQCLTELDTLCGTDWAKPAAAPKRRPEFAPLRQVSLPAPTVKTQVHQPWSPTRLEIGLPPLPQPYETFAQTTSYGWKEETA